MKINFLAILVLLSTYTVAQHSISGHVTDQITNKGLIGANISIIGNNSSVTATDSNGYFQISDLAAGNYKLKIKMIMILLVMQMQQSIIILVLEQQQG